MANKVITNGYLSVNSVNLSPFVRSMTLSYSAEEKDDTAMGDSARSHIGGLKDWALDVEFFQDYAVSAVDATLFSIVGTAVPIEVRSDAGAVSATNPKFTGTGLIVSYQPVAGTVGENQMAPVRIIGVGNLARATS